jgi:hypothetical protein
MWFDEKQCPNTRPIGTRVVKSKNAADRCCQFRGAPNGWVNEKKPRKLYFSEI